MTKKNKSISFFCSKVMLHTNNNVKSKGDPAAKKASSDYVSPDLWEKMREKQ